MEASPAAAAGPSLGRKAGLEPGGTRRPWEEQDGHGGAEGPPRGFPGDALRLPGVGDPSRAAACFANKVFSSTGCYASAYRRLSPARTAEADPLRRRRPPAERASEHADRGSGGNSRLDGVAAAAVGGQGVGRPTVEVPKVFTLSARDVRVEFPYQASVCPGDMEHGDVVRWLRRFRGSARAYEGAGMPPPGLVGDVLVELPAAGIEDADGAGGGAKKPVDVVSGLRAPGRSSDPASTASGDQAAAAGSGLPQDGSSSHAPWACQYVEAREFDLSVAVSGGADNGDDDRDSGGGVLPNLNCAISGVSVSTAGYASTGGGSGCYGGDCCCGGGGRRVRRGRSSDLGAKEQATEESPSVPLSAPSRSRGGNSAEGRCGVLFPGTGSSSSSRLSVSLGGTRHRPNSRKR